MRTARNQDGPGTTLGSADRSTLCGPDVAMTPIARDGANHLRYRAIFPNAVGTGVIIQSSGPICDATRTRLIQLIEDFEATLSRFREDSLVGLMSRATHGGAFDFPEWSSPLFDLTDRFVDLAGGRLDPCVGEDLMRLGYGSDLTFRMAADAPDHLGSLHGRPTWEHDVVRNGTTLRTRGPLHLDFGLCGKGFLVDLMTSVLLDEDPGREFLVNAGGDMRARADEPLAVGLEDPRDEDAGVGVARLSSGALCASSPSRRHWRASAALEAHHLINALDGMPVTDVAATWTHVPDRDGDGREIAYPTATADGLATALFLLPVEALLPLLPFSCLTLSADLHATIGGDFPGTVFTS
ncbi:FAD:protein FMN transferase [uncultured Bifidobacterium sp.]|uniref:FAD:protein FMN transferase n=1 Tax=uncultured Bifidobacterium sp. TaxID=165187 RepID=UPI00260F3C98|nr:FAD:protein FMN transferase [uncultured Bifidobacterium sp.]